MTYSLGNVKPWVRSAAEDIGPRFGIRTVYGYSYRNIAGTSTLSDHALGLALDFMCDIPTGNALASYVQAHAGEYNVTYIIHNRRIWSVARQGEGWRPYTGVNPHTDHVHVSFLAKPTGAANPAPNAQGASFNPGIPLPNLPHIPLPHVPTPQDAAGTVKDTYQALVGMAKFAALLANPHTWLRVLMFGAGLWLLIVGVSMMITNQNAADATMTVARHVARTSTKVANNAG